MSVLINIKFRNDARIIQIVPEEEKLDKSDIENAVRNTYDITESIQFYDGLTKFRIVDILLVAYVEQFRNAPGWWLDIRTDQLENSVADNNISLETDYVTRELEEEEEITNTIETLNNSQLSNIETVPYHTFSCQRIEQQEIIETIQPLETSQLSNIATVPYHTLSCHRIEDFGRNCVQTIITERITSEILRNLPDLDFKIIYANYEKQNCLSNSHKIKVAKIIVKYIFEININIERVSCNLLNKPDLLYLAEIICRVFPTEIKDIYYTCALCGQKPSGKVYDAYSNYRKHLSSAGLIRRKQISSTARISSTDISENLEPDALIDFEYVKNNSQPADILIQSWNNSHTERFKILETKISTHEYLSMFPVFKLNELIVFDLFTADTKILYPNIININNTWTELYNKVLLKAKKLSDSTVKAWLKEIKDCSEDTKKAVAFLILPYFFPATNIKKKLDKKSYKVSKLEVQEQFIAHFKTLQQADNFEEKLLRSNSGVQPRIVFIGDLHDLTAYITLIDKKYMVGDPVKAVENTFMTFWALNLEYPAESHIVWNFVQKYIFGVTTSHDINKPSLKAVYQKLSEN